MSVDIALKQIEDARKEHKDSRKFCQAMIVVVVVALVLFGIFAWKTSNYYLVFGEALAAVIKPLLKHMEKLSGYNVEIMQRSGKMVVEASNQNRLVEEIRRQQESDRQRREE